MEKLQQHKTGTGGVYLYLYFRVTAAGDGS